jgi:hypothetical protein
MLGNQWEIKHRRTGADVRLGVVQLGARVEFGLPSRWSVATNIIRGELEGV